ncbi:hypothetical protein HRED_07951 [Candidatus Haloredivivus sp. G17]|nr:hypothetical protein HRED_07951 [Candidatus Haloredivivus sp. G17]
MAFEDYSLKEGLTATLAAVLANLTVVAISQNLLMTNGEFMPLTFGPVAVFTAIAGVLGFGAWGFSKDIEKKHRETTCCLYL